MTTTVVLSHRDRAILRAVGAAQARFTGGAAPALLIDGRWCCDQHAAHLLTVTGLIAPTRPAIPTTSAPAVLTAAGRAALDAATGTTPGAALAAASPLRRGEAPATESRTENAA